MVEPCTTHRGWVPVYPLMHPARLQPRPRRQAQSVDGTEHREGLLREGWYVEGLTFHPSPCPHGQNTSNQAFSSPKN